jgi:predicted secreted protein
MTSTLIGSLRVPLSLHTRSSLALTTTLVALLSACSSVPEVPKPPPLPPVIQAAGQRVLTVTDANAGAAVVLETTQTLMVRLPIGTASGFEWSLVDLKPGVVSAIGPKFERAPRNANPAEADGAAVWRFKPETVGTVALSFELRRPRTLLPAVQTLRYDVTVK